MRLARLMTGALLPLLMAACAPADDEVDALDDGAVVFDEPAEMTPPAAMTGADEMGESFDLAALNNSGVTGTVSVTDLGAQTEVMVTLNGLEANSAHAGHIHMGTCANIGGIVAPLEEITAGAAGTGTMTTTIAAAPGTVMNGQHLVAYHQNPGDDHGAALACAPIPMHDM